MESSFVVACCMVAALIIMVPKRIWRYLSAYTLVIDVGASAYVVHMGVATGTVTGLTAGFMAALMLSVTIRGIKYFVGADRVALNGETRLSKVVAGLATQGSKWVRSITKAVFTGSEVIAPDPLNWSLVEVAPARGLHEILDDFRSLFAGAVEA